MEQLAGKADLHVHTKYSDGANSVAEVLQHVVEYTDLDVIAITDHDTIDGALEAARIAPGFGLDVIIGEEISTAQGHLLALFIERAITPGQSAAATVKQVHEQGGLCIAAHPFGVLVPSLGRDGWRRRQRSLAHLLLDGIESLNASLWDPCNNKLAERIAHDLNVASCGGSDSHHVATIGAGYTLFPGRSAADLRSAIEQRRTQASGRFWGWHEVMVATMPFISRELRYIAHRALPAAARR